MCGVWRRATPISWGLSRAVDFCWGLASTPVSSGGALTCSHCRKTGTLGSPHKRAAGSPCHTGTHCRGTGRGHCKRTPAGFGSHLWTGGTGRLCPGSPVCRGTCHSGIHHGLGNSVATASHPCPAPDPRLHLPLIRAWPQGWLLALCLSVCPHHPLCPSLPENSPVPPQILPL